VNESHFKVKSLLRGGVSERPMVTVLKTVVGASRPWVRIPPPPPNNAQNHLRTYFLNFFDFSLDLNDNCSQMITITRLDQSRWQDYRDLRLEALKAEPLAFGSSFEEEQLNSETYWRQHIQNVLFAVSGNRAVGLMVYAQNNRLKTKHICGIYGVYLKNEYRGQGIGNQLMDTVLSEIQKLNGVVKIELAVNPTQKAAKKLYSKYGFKTAGKSTKALQIDGKFYNEIMMEKFLG
jgi:ribosomal protein S18 acetylase RimI-like enzyme